METLHGVLLELMILSFAIYNLVQAQDQQGFVSLDCGLQADEPPYTEPLTKLTFSSDAGFIKTGKSGRIQYVPGTKYVKPYTVLRYFPNGVRNCYTLKVIQGTNYLIAAIFNYGNYDGLNIHPKFDLYLGPNIWTTVDLQKKSINVTRVEIIHIPKSTSLQVCFVKTGETTPLISALELRPLRNGTYIANSGSLKNLFRFYFSDSVDTFRYPNDVHDRLWSPFSLSEWTMITTSLSVNTPNDYDIPKDVLRCAAVPTNASSPWTISWVEETPNDQVYVYLHLAEIQSLKKNETRVFDIVSSGNVTYGTYSPKELQVRTLFNTAPANCKGGICQLQLIRTRNSTLPPLVNAMEAFTTIEFQQSETNVNDVIAIKRIEAIYGLGRINWEGDPCVPQKYLWDGLTCKYANMSTPPRIISLDLSSSGLTGAILPEIQNLTQLQILDLSNNNLTGEVPEFLGNMKSLLLVNLSGNNLNGSIPQVLLDKEKQGLELNIQGNPKLCTSNSCKTKKKGVLLRVVASTASLVVAVALLSLFFVCRRKILSSHKGVSDRKPSIITKKIRFTYSEILAMTNKFERILGQGGFGMVYHGLINGTEEVAVKVLSPSSTQGYKEFKTEVELLLRVHHTNLVSLVGYCDEHDQLALVYEYMSNGDLKKHLSGNFVLSWATRLKIAVDAAQGLEYLHIGCKPLIVHRDVKSSNILLDDQAQAKLADFGLSKSFPAGSETHVSTVIAGTPGYLDPEYFQTNKLSERNDVYSFGIVLLEMITNQRVIDQTREKHHIAEWVKFMLIRGDIINIMDPKLEGMHDNGSAWKAIELAMICVNPSSLERPDMSHVVHELKECLILEKKRTGDISITRSLNMNFSFSSDVTPKAR